MTRDSALVLRAQRVAARALTAYAEGASALPAVLEARRSAREVLAQYIDDRRRAADRDHRTARPHPDPARSMIRSVRAGHRSTLGACAAVSLLLAACAKKDAGGSEAEGEKAPKPVVAVSTTKATVEPFTHTLSAIGSVVARPGRYAALSAPSPTRVSRVYVTEGQRVAVGTPLVQFEQVGFAAAASGAQAALTAAQHAYDRAERLSREGIVPRKDVEQAAAELGAARSAAVTARRAQQLSVLRSPVSGVVTRMSAALGASVDAGQTLVEVADPRRSTSCSRSGRPRRPRYIRARVSRCRPASGAAARRSAPGRWRPWALPWTADPARSRSA